MTPLKIEMWIVAAPGEPIQQSEWMPSRSSLPPEFDGVAFAVRDALSAGARPTRLRSSDLANPFWGVRTSIQDAATVAGRARAYLSRAAPGHFISHASAALIWDIPLPRRLQAEDWLHVSVSTEQRAPRGSGVIGHRLRLEAGDITTHSGIRLTSLARTWCDLATSLREEELVAAGDNVLWYRRPEATRVTVSELRTTAQHHGGRRGRPAIRSSLPLLSDWADSFPESVIRVRMIRAGLPVPSVNLELYDDQGRFLAMPDMSYPRYSLSFDYEGDHHRTDPEQWEKDLARVPRLERAHWHHTRISKADLRNSRDFLERTRALLLRKGWLSTPDEGR
jgi:hypothetical protein